MLKEIRVIDVILGKNIFTRFSIDFSSVFTKNQQKSYFDESEKNENFWCFSLHLLRHQAFEDYDGWNVKTFVHSSSFSFASTTFSSRSVKNQKFHSHNIFWKKFVKSTFSSWELLCKMVSRIFQGRVNFCFFHTV